MVAFLIWLIAGCAFICFGIYAYTSKKQTAFGFWANAEMFQVENVESYNKALGKLWCVFGVVFALLGLPLLKGQNSPAALITIIGVMVEAIAAMVIYVTVIEKKYRKR